METYACTEIKLLRDNASYIIIPLVDTASYFLVENMDPWDSRVSRSPVKIVKLETKNKLQNSIIGNMNPGYINYNCITNISPNAPFFWEYVCLHNPIYLDTIRLGQMQANIPYLEHLDIII